MKITSSTIRTLLVAPLFAMACSYDFPEPDPSTLPSAGSADFTKYVSIGNSLTAGYMDGALYARSQGYSFPSILAKQFELVGGGAFNQPTVTSETGCYDPATGCKAGRLYFKADGKGGATLANKPGDATALGAYTGDKTALNNFGVPGLTIQTALAKETGTPGNPLFNPYYARFASNPGASTPIGDASAALKNGTFFTFWLGNNDAILYALAGADPTRATLTSETNFNQAYTLALGAILTANPNAKGVVANIPDVTTLPHFFTVAWNVVAFDAAKPVDVGTVQALNTNFAGLNSALDATVTYLGHDQADANRRKVKYATGANPVLIYDETLTSMATEFDMLRTAGAISAEQRAALQPYVQSRQATSTDLIALPAASVIGTSAGSATAIWGVSVPLPDQYVLIPSETQEIQARIKAFNATIKATVDANSTRVALVDAYTILNNIKAAGAAGISVGGIGLNSTLQPPYGFFSADGVHPNARGSAYMANQFIATINAAFGAHVTTVNPNDYPGNDLPVAQ